MVPAKAISSAASAVFVPAAAAGKGVMLAGALLYQAYKTEQDNAQRAGQAEFDRRVAESQKRRESQELATELALQRWQANNPKLTMPQPVQAAAVAEQAEQLSKEMRGNPAAEQQLQQELEVQIARATLLGLLNAAGSLLPEALRDAATATLKENRAAALKDMQQRVEAALRQTNDQQTITILAAQACRNILREVGEHITRARTWLAAVTTLDARMLDTLAQQLPELERLAEANPTGALDQLRPFRADVEEVANNIQRAYAKEWEHLLKEASAQRGRVTALRQILQEAQGQQMTADASVSVSLDLIKTELERWTGAHSDTARKLGEARAALEKITKRIDHANDEVFESIGQAQQKVIGETISQTLGELGFVDSTEEEAAPLVESSGNQLHIIGKRQTPGEEKVIAFFVDRDGAVTYDFSGYKREEITEASREVFAAFNRKGLVIVDNKTADRLSESPLTPATLNLRNFENSEREINTRQGQLRERVYKALNQLGFRRVEEQVVAGNMMLEAIGSNVSYSITLPSDSNHNPPEVRRMDQAGSWQDISPDETADPVVAELQKEPAHEHRAKPRPWYQEYEHKKRQTTASSGASISQGT